MNRNAALLAAARRQPPRLAGTDAQETLRRLELEVTRRLDGLLHGDHLSLVPGHGSEPGDSRAYTPGDDVRRIDWNVTARTNEVHVRDTIAERELEVWLVADLSASLEFGTAECRKRDLAAASAAALGFLTARGGNRLGALVVRGGGVATVPPRGGRAHLLGVLHRLISEEIPDGGGSTDLGAALHRLAGMARRRSLVVVISDFLATPGWERALGVVGTRHDLLAVEVIDPRELELPPVGMLDLVDPETGRRLEVPTSSARLRRRYTEAAVAQRHAIAAGLRGAGADHLRLRTDHDWLADLLAYVQLRRRRARAATAMTARTR